MNKKRIAIITGASSGLGREFARQMDQYKLDELWLIARREKRLNELSNELKTKVLCLTLDLSQQNSLTEFANHLVQQSPCIHYLINNAGFGKIGDFASIPLVDQHAMVEVNCTALMQLCHFSIPFMPAGSRIINISSIAGFAPLGGTAVYAATKAFVTSFSVALASELRDKHIYTTVVCPGPVDTEFSSVARTGSLRKKKIFTAKASAPQVVAQALKDASARKLFSIFGTKSTFLAIASKILPMELVAKISLNTIYVKQ